MFWNILPLLKQARPKKRSHDSSLRPNRQDGSPWPQICFLHLIKTGGSTINDLFKQRVSDQSGIGLIPEDMDRMPPGHLQKLDVVSSHMSARHFPLLRPHRFMFTFLRNPVDRVISNYYYLRSYPGPLDCTNTGLLSSAKNKSFYQFLLDPHPQVRSVTQNMQANALVSDWRAEHRLDSPDLAEKAIEAIQQFHFVGLFDHFTENLKLLFNALHWELKPGDTELVVNKTPQRPLVSEVEHRCLELIRELNSADQELYDFVNSHIVHSTDSGGPVFQPLQAPLTVKSAH